MAPVFGEKKEKYMKKASKRSIVQGTFGRMQEMPKDFLPRPEDLVLRPSSTRVTLMVDNTTLHFFKIKARELGVPYQRMIRNLLNKYREILTATD